MLGERPSAAPTDRRTARREATKAEILDAAWDLVARARAGRALAARPRRARGHAGAVALPVLRVEARDLRRDVRPGRAARRSTSMIADIRRRPRASTARGAHRFFEFATSDPARAQLLFQRTIPGFEPSPEAYAPAVETLSSPGRRLAGARHHRSRRDGPVDRAHQRPDQPATRERPRRHALGPPRRPHGRHVPRATSRRPRRHRTKGKK